MKNKYKGLLVLACFAMLVSACTKSPKVADEMEQSVGVQEIETVEENLDEATEDLKAETEHLEEDIDELLKGI